MTALPTVSLDNCPVGLFLFNETLGMKTEYSTDASPGSQCDAYVVSSGEYFWGGTDDWRTRAQLQVTPLYLDDQPTAFWAQFSYQPDTDNNS